VYLVTPESASGSTSVFPWLWPGEMLLAYWPVCKFDLILPVVFLAAFNILTTISAYHLPLYQCAAIAFRIRVLSVRFIVPLVVQCYLCALVKKSGYALRLLWFRFSVQISPCRLWFCFFSFDFGFVFFLYFFSGLHFTLTS